MFLTCSLFSEPRTASLARLTWITVFLPRTDRSSSSGAPTAISLVFRMPILSQIL